MPRPPSSILFENADRTVVVVDLPRSIEEAQEVIDDGSDDGAVDTTNRRRRRLLSAPAPNEPFATPRGSDAVDHTAGRSPAAQLAELTTRAAVEGALDELKAAAGFDSPWCLPRYLPERPVQDGNSISKGDSSDSVYIPPGARYLDGTIAACRNAFLAEAPEFDLIVLDPPWPNRSARRRRQGRKRKSSALFDGEENADTLSRSRDTDSGYDTAPDMEALRAMLEQIPVGAKLVSGGVGGNNNEGGLVAVWLTNKPACEALLTDPKCGLFRAWGVELVATWTWIKVTSRGEPVVAVDAQWRKPWERLLLARRPSGGASSNTKSALPAHRVIAAVPDVHSRKPHLRSLLAPFISSSSAATPADREFRGLEIFARNLTANWWAWGNEVLLFQHPSWWTADAELNEVHVDAGPVNGDSTQSQPNIEI